MIIQAIQAEKAKGVTIRFEIRSGKLDKSGRAPVRLIFQIKGQRKYYNSGVSILPHYWNTSDQQAVYIDKKRFKAFKPSLDPQLFLSEIDVTEFNDRLLNLIKACKAITDRYKLDDTRYSAEMVVNQLRDTRATTTKKSDPSNLVYDFIDQYIQDNTASREPGSLTVYRSLKNHLQAYQGYTRKQISFENIDVAFLQSFQNFLINLRKTVDGGQVPRLNNTTIAKQLSTLKTFLNYAKLNGIKVSDQYKNFKIKKEQLEVISLTPAEFDILFYMDLQNNARLAQTRDIFCFSCCTGLRYSDLRQLKWEHVKANEIKIKIIKTDDLLTIPLTPYSRQLLEKYSSQNSPLPMISNQNLNYYIKELCELAGINEPTEVVRSYGIKREARVHPKYELISAHTGRKTFVTLSLDWGMSSEQVMAITGHKDYQSFKRYVHVTNQSKHVAMGKAWGTVNEQIETVVQ